MFWKNKLTESEIIFYESKERWKHFRVYPAKSAPIFLIYNAEQAQVINISAGGLSFKGKSLKKGDSLLVEFKLPHQHKPISPLLVVKKVDRKKVCHCHFKEIGAEDSEAIHRMTSFCRVRTYW